ncbi:Chloromuconate cycloisomerase protein [Halorhabdus tiamatea SARL4B]|uniref:o-succinylbenzoate synthase n=1 Tax=Halorhabdus tiamatea SARL4B TaxID=1033806 RepID=F7PQP4_9EURY|nr:o-succinylbenzoate synthase [Halorhabdus tiamatea]ERJ04717.1 Chloromuconate cycloisomerase protein [Halorhabdus tiamatea SARL4B]CCQ34703.1 O-succinylbenzoate-CoA synthase [Halorhabdus tiamatea SARL4B]
MDVEPVSLPLSSALSTAAGTIDRREGFLITLEEPPGIGEAMPLPGWTESLEACRDALETATSIVSDCGVEAALDDLDPTATPAARHGLDLAIADRRARVAGQSLARYLGQTPRESVPVNATVGDAPAKKTAERATAAVDAGFGTVKVKVGARSVDADVSRIQAVRDAIGPAATIRADANAAWRLSETRRAIEELATVDVSYVEQPLAADDLPGHAALRGGDVEIALDESLRATGLDAIAAADAADVLVLKPMALGGVRRTRSLALEARARGIDPVITTTVDGVVARTAAIHLAASLGIERACGLATADRLREDLAPDPAPVEEGRIAVPDGPGIGVEFE